MEAEQPQDSLYIKLKLYIKSLSQRQKYIVGLFGLIILFVVFVFFHMPPKDFPIGQVFTVNSGESLQSIAADLQNAHIIKSPFFFRAAVIIQGGEKRVIAGDYLLDQRVGPVDLAYRLVNGKFHLEAKKITIPEGWSVSTIGDYLEKNLIKFDKVQFLNLAEPKEGYLFPDTYFVSPAIKPENIISIMNDNFNTKIKIISGVATSTHNLKDIIIMASILENEARTTESRRIIAGILWKRLSLGMPLQVDSTLTYINGKGTFELTAADLKIDSPYNTYIYKGLPPGPIGNPGVDAITDAITPTTTKYLYYLSDKSGTMHYATTFAEHIKNRQLYLNK